MTTPFSALRLFAALLFFALISPAQAAWTTHAYNATVIGMYEFDPSTAVTRYSASSVFPGAQIQNGDQFFGFFQYDTGLTPLFGMPVNGGVMSAYAPTSGPNGAFSFSSSLGPLEYILVSDASSSSMAVYDNGLDGGDYLGLNFRRAPGEFLQSYSFFFNNSDGQAWSGTELPVTLDLADFDLGAYFVASWTRESDGIEFHAFASITSLMSLPPYEEAVPEPSGILLFLAAAGIAVFVSRKRAA